MLMTATIGFTCLGPLIVKWKSPIILDAFVFRLAKPVNLIEHPLSLEYIFIRAAHDLSFVCGAPLFPPWSSYLQLFSLKLERPSSVLTQKSRFGRGLRFLRQIALGNVKRACSIVPLFSSNPTTRVSRSINADQKELVDLPVVSQLGCFVLLDFISTICLNVDESRQLPPFSLSQTTSAGWRTTV